MTLLPDDTGLMAAPAAPPTATALAAPFDATITNPIRLDRVRRAAAARAEPQLDRLTHAAVAAIRAPVAAVAFVGQDRQIFKSVTGLPAAWNGIREIPLSHSFCVHAVSTGEPLIVPDARRHPLVRGNPSVSELGVLAYAGIPLKTRDGLVLGTFHTLSWSPREWTDSEVALLRGLAAVAMMEIERELDGTPRVSNGTPTPRSTGGSPRVEPSPSVAIARDRREAVLRQRLQRAIGDAFLVGQRIGRGGFADVFDGWDRRLKRPVALKVPRPDLANSAERLERFRGEAESIASVRHPHVLPIHMIGEGDGLMWLVLARVFGESVEAWMARAPAAPIDETTRILRAVASALHAAHTAGIVHRDLTPGNIMLDGPERHVFLMDFGLARAMDVASLRSTEPGTFVGTPHFMSPEQATGDRADQRSDLYSLGAIGYRLLTGRLPVDGPNLTTIMMGHIAQTPTPIRRLRPECPSWLARVVERCLAKDPDDRWSTAEEIVHAIDMERSHAA